MERVKLGDIATVITKGTTPTTIGFNFVENGVNFIKIESIAENGQFLQDKFSFINNECNQKLKRSQLQENDILFSIAGAIGRTAIVTKDILPANTNQALAIIRIPEGSVDYSYLLYVLQSPIIIEQFEKKKQGVAQLNLSLKDVGEFEIPLPSLAEQIIIAQKIRKLELVENAYKQSLEKLETLKKALMQKYFG